MTAAAIIGLLTALPELIGLLKSMGVALSSFWNWLVHVSGGDPSGYIVKIGAAFSQLNQAKTPEEHSDAAKTIADLFHSLPGTTPK